MSEIKIERRLRKSSARGWIAEAIVELGNAYRLKVETYRSDSGPVFSNATVHRAVPSGAAGLICEQHSFGGSANDYRTQLISRRYSRVTSKVIEEQMNEAMTYFDMIMSEVRTHYGERLELKG